MASSAVPEALHSIPSIAAVTRGIRAFAWMQLAPPERGPENEDPLAMIFTSGTAGEPRLCYWPAFAASDILQKKRV